MITPSIIKSMRRHIVLYQAGIHYNALYDVQEKVALINTFKAAVKVLDAIALRNSNVAGVPAKCICWDMNGQWQFARRKLHQDIPPV